MINSLHKYYLKQKVEQWKDLCHGTGKKSAIKADVWNLNWSYSKYTYFVFIHLNYIHVNIKNGIYECCSVECSQKRSFKLALFII